MADENDAEIGKKPDKAKAKSYPKRIKLTHHHGWIDEENNAEHFHKAGTVIADPALIKTLVDRGALFVEHTDEDVEADKKAAAKAGK